MNCPKCQTEMKVTNTYQAGEVGKTQRLECPACKCECVTFVATLLIAVQPGWGEGAVAAAKKIGRNGKKAVKDAQNAISSLID